MAALLFFEPFAQGFHQLVETACRFDLGFFLGGQMLLSHLFQPVLGDIYRFKNVVQGDVFQAFKRCGKGLVELVDVAFVFDHADAGEVIEGIDIIGRKTRCHPV